MGYHVTTVTPANMAPRAQAELPSMTIFPAVAFMRSTRWAALLAKVLEAKSYPARAAFQFNSAALALRLPNCLTSAFCTSSMSTRSEERRVGKECSVGLAQQ